MKEFFTGRSLSRERTLKSGFFLDPLLRGGVFVPIKKMKRYLSLGTTGEVKRLLKPGLIETSVRPPPLRCF
jgi:hypothetical protein